MAYQLIGAHCTGCGHDGDERKGTFYAYITRVIEKSTPFFVSLIDDLCKRAVPDDAAGVLLILDCATYWRNYTFLGSMATTVMKRRMKPLGIDFECEEHGKGTVDGGALSSLSENRKREF